MKRQLSFPLSQLQGIEWLKKFKTQCGTKKLLPMYQLAIELAEETPEVHKPFQEIYLHAIEYIEIFAENKQRPKARREINNIFYLAFLIQFFNQRKLEKGNAEKLIAKIKKHEALENNIAKDLLKYFMEGTLVGFENQHPLTPHELGDISLLLAKGESDTRTRLKNVIELLNADLKSYDNKSQWVKYFKSQGEKTFTDKYSYIVFRLLYLYKNILGNEILKEYKTPKAEIHHSVIFVTYWLTLMGINLLNRKKICTLMRHALKQNYEFTEIHKLTPNKFYDWVVKTFPNVIGEFREFTNNIRQPKSPKIN